ncbi:MAG TPA: isocitrate/isopropylmalate family dehydrogenase [Candidatus Bathyarchaeia archaeon]|nr:isocitrate/isopropylmalate family dehydrogenase [Candidatus Bathyarchaeia archaeon]
MQEVAVILGDGVGPELIKAMMRVVAATGAPVNMIPCQAGSDWWESHGGDSLIPDETWDVINSTTACFKGPTTTPGGPGSPRSVAVTIRQEKELFANVRPIKTFANTPRPLGDVNFVCVREATEGLYSGSELQLSNDMYVALRKITKSASQRIARFAFAEADKRGWTTVVAIHKSNILKQTDGAFLQAVREVKRRYADIELWEYHVDNVAQQLVKNPQVFNESILLSTNLFMDILSEECAALVGSIGMIYSANFGDTYAMFEPAHGSAPKYQNLDKVNPTATVLAGAWMLDYVGLKHESMTIFNALEETVVEGNTTYDLGGPLRTSQVTDCIIDKVERSLDQAG